MSKLSESHLEKLCKFKCTIVEKNKGIRPYLLILLLTNKRKHA